MAKMARKQFFITAEQKLLIKRRPALTGLSQAEIIRRGIDRELEQAPPAVEKQRRCGPKGSAVNSGKMKT